MSEVAWFTTKHLSLMMLRKQEEQSDATQRDRMAKICRVTHPNMRLEHSHINNLQKSKPQRNSSEGQRRALSNKP
eukprot:3455467-Amphidinium_carterae.1